MPHKKICLMSTFFHGRALNYLRWYCEELLEYYDLVCFLHYDRLCPSDSDWLFSHAGRIMPHRLEENRGYDFGAWYHALHALAHRLDDVTHLGMANDSCVPFKKFKPFFDWFDKSGNDYAGFTNNQELHYHIQTNFVVVRGEAPIQTLLKHFRQTGVLPKKWDVIKQYEVGLSRTMRDSGHRIGSFLDCTTSKINWTIRRPAELIRHGFPLVKRRLGVHRFIPLMREISYSSGENVNIDYITEGIAHEFGTEERIALTAGIR